MGVACPRFCNPLLGCPLQELVYLHSVFFFHRLANQLQIRLAGDLGGWEPKVCLDPSSFLSLRTPSLIQDWNTAVPDKKRRKVLLTLSSLRSLPPSPRRPPSFSRLSPLSHFSLFFFFFISLAFGYIEMYVSCFHPR